MMNYPLAVMITGFGFYYHRKKVPTKSFVLSLAASKTEEQRFELGVFRRLVIRLLELTMKCMV